eukprot:INCI15015.1.p1 GENE.INCI15015.1~~INCI15015.1.p1  ORF type:complete len:675 (+),score=105.47 INCI15015.1:284-2308(+)
MCTVHPQTAARAGVLFAALAVFLYILWLSNNSNRDAVQSLRSASANIRRSQYMQQELLNRVEYRLAATSSKYTELQRAFGEEFAASMAENRDSTHSLYQSTLQKAGAALKQADMETAVEMLTKTNHELLNKLNLVEQRRSGNSSSIRRVKDALAEEKSAQADLQNSISALDEKIRTTIGSLEQKYPEVQYLVSQLASVDSDLLEVNNELLRVLDLKSEEEKLTQRHISTIEKLAMEQRFGDDPPKVGTTLCFSSIMQSDIDSGQAQVVSRLYRKMCDKYVQFGEGQLLVPVEDSTAAEPYVLGTHVIPLALTQPSSHAENWEKLNTALTYIHDHFFNYDFYLKVDPDTYFFAGNYQYFMAYMSRKWGDRFVNEPLYAGLPLHHHAPSYNSGHVYILNRKSVELVFNALQISRQVLSPDFAKDADSYPLSCKWNDPVPDKFLPGCAQMCQRFSTIHQAKAHCEIVPDCQGIVDNGPKAPAEGRFELRASKTFEDSASGESAIVKGTCPDEDEDGIDDSLLSEDRQAKTKVQKVPFTPECSYTLRTPEDLQLGHCFYSLGVRTWDTRDNRGREFLSFTDPKTWSQGFSTVMTVPWYYRGRYFDNYGTIAKHLAEHIISIHVGYDPSLKHCWPQIYDAVCAMEPNSDYGRKTLTTSGAIGEWFDNHRWEVLNTPICK